MTEAHIMTAEVKPEEEQEEEEDDNDDSKDYDNQPWNNMENVEHDDSVLPPTIARPADAKKVLRDSTLPPLCCSYFPLPTRSLPLL